jgi:hypothetical protein
MAAESRAADSTGVPDEPRDVMRHRGDFSPSFSLHGFADVTASAEDIDPEPVDDGGSARFALGELDLYMNSQLAPNLSALGEIVFEFSDDDEAVVDMERLFLKYAYSDLLWVSMGRRHTAMGYWNPSYHHGRVLQPTIERPAVLRFEDDGGILPIHNVGIQAGGRFFHERWGLDYSALLANGRGPRGDNVQDASDANGNKAIGLAASIQRQGSGWFSFGPVLYLDRIPEDAMTPGREEELDERIWGAHLTYRSGKIEFIAEYYEVRHESRGSGLRWNHEGYFAIAVWNRPHWRPYVGLDRLDLDAGDRFFEAATEEDRLIVGVRRNPNPATALKLEYWRAEPQGVTVDTVAIQIAYSF